MLLQLLCKEVKTVFGLIRGNLQGLYPFTTCNSITCMCFVEFKKSRFQPLLTYIYIFWTSVALKCISFRQGCT